jgi:UDP-N-acetylmuramate dehydrogenase
MCVVSKSGMSRLGGQHRTSHKPRRKGKRDVGVSPGKLGQKGSTALFNRLATQVRGSVKLDEPLTRYTTYRIGGPAAALVVPRDSDDVVRLVQLCRETETPWLPLGLGSNVLISDQGFPGVVIRLGKGMDGIRVGTGDGLWWVGAGVPTPRLARRTAAAGFAGMQRLIGVPGTVGGGVAMNAGAHGQEFSQVVRRVDVVNSAGELHTLRGSDVPWRYRGSGLEDVVITAVTLQLSRGDPAVLRRDVERHMRWRREGTPFDEPCCGSVFRNPATIDGGEGPQHASSRSAGQLIDAAGLKGFRIGGAAVSPKHANYIVNLGGATAADVLGVIEAIQGRVLHDFGIELELEVKIIGQGAGSGERGAGHR